MSTPAPEHPHVHPDPQAHPPEHANDPARGHDSEGDQQPLAQDESGDHHAHEHASEAERHPHRSEAEHHEHGSEGEHHEHGSEAEHHEHGSEAEHHSHGSEVDHHEHGEGEHHEHSHAHDEHSHAHENGLRSTLGHFFRPHSHDAADSIDNALEGSAEGIRVVQLSLVGLGLTAILQLVIVLSSHSVALLADTIHNFADASTALPLWLAFSIGRRPPTRRYTYGFGRAEDLAGIFVVLMIAGSSLVAAWESIQKLLHPQPITQLGWVALAAFLGFLGNEAVAQYRIRAGDRIGSAALIADGYHARTDGFTSLAVLIGVVGVWLGFPQADPLVGLVITIAILLVLKDAVRQVWARLMDAIDPVLLDHAREAAAAAEGVQAVEEIRARWIGHSIHAEALIVADCELSLAQAHAVAERASHAMMHAVPKLSGVTVHVDPCTHHGFDAHAEVAHHQQSR